MPASYAVDGRQYLVVPVAAGTGLFPGRFADAPAAGQGPTGGYIAYALPE